MKKSLIVISTALVILMTGCVKDLEKEGVLESGITVLTGRVVEGTNHTALPNIRVLVTNGSQTYVSTISNEEGAFVLSVDYNKIDGTYYLLLDGGSDDVRKKEDLRGMTVRVYDYRDIVLFSLPSFQYGGHTYQVAPDPGNTMAWDVAFSYCNSLTMCNLSGWTMPTKEELIQMYVERNTIGGFQSSYYWSCSVVNNDHYSVDFSNGNVANFWGEHNVRPIRRVD